MYLMDNLMVPPMVLATADLKVLLNKLVVLMVEEKGM